METGDLEPVTTGGKLQAPDGPPLPGHAKVLDDPLYAVPGSTIKAGGGLGTPDFTE